MRDSLASLAASLGEDIQMVAVGRLLLMLVLGGSLALFVRLLYLRFSRSQSNPEGFSAGFAPLTVSTVLVISVVKSSLALSLGLVGALSIVRFRAAIKDPEELIYLFFCIALGLALGADQLLAALAGLLVFTLFIVTQHRTRMRSRRHNLLLTISGDRDAFFGEDAAAAQQSIDSVLGPYQIQRLECEEDRVQLRATVRPDSAAEITRLMAELQERLPRCQVSYVNLDNLL